MRNSSEKELQKILDRYKPLYEALYFYALKLLHDEHQAKSIVLSKFAQHWKMGLFNESEVAIRRKLYIAVRNACFDELRKQKRVKEGHAQIAENMEHDGQPDPPDIAMTKGQLFADLKRMIAELDPRFGNVIEGHFLEGIPIKELAVQMRIPESKVSYYKRRGLKLLKKKFQQRNPQAMNIFALYLGE
jgi:RNA polymerase sigma factor (sigma-70 family)